MYEIYISNLIFKTNVSKFPNLEKAVTVEHSDSILIHSDSIPNKECKIVEGHLKIADNSSGSLEISISSDNPGYNIIQPLVTEVTVIKDGFDIWYGRLLTVDEDFWRQKKCVFEGELSYLLDSLQTPETYVISFSDNNSAYINFITNGQTDTIDVPNPETYGLTDETKVNVAYFLRRWLTEVLAKHNGAVEPYKRFTLGETPTDVDLDFILNGKDRLEISTNFENTLDVIKSNFLDLGMDVHAVIRHSYKNKSNEYERIIDFVTGFKKNTGGVQTINFGENLLDYTSNLDGSVFYTVLYPRGNTIEHTIFDGDSEYVCTTDAEIMEGKTYYDLDIDHEADTYVYQSVSPPEFYSDGLPFSPIKGLELDKPESSSYGLLNKYKGSLYEKYDYFRSTDREVVKHKTYYKKSVEKLYYVYKYVELTSNRDNPHERGWFERIGDNSPGYGYGRPYEHRPPDIFAMVPSYTYVPVNDMETSVIYGKEYFTFNPKGKLLFGGYVNIESSNGYPFNYTEQEEDLKDDEYPFFNFKYLGYYFIVEYKEDPSVQKKFKINGNFENYVEKVKEAGKRGLNGFKPTIYAYRGDYITVEAVLKNGYGKIEDYKGEKSARELTENTCEDFQGDRNAEQLLSSSLLSASNEGKYYRATEDFKTNDLYIEGEGNSVHKYDYVRVIEEDSTYHYQIMNVQPYHIDNPYWEDKYKNKFFRAREDFEANELFIKPGEDIYEGDLIQVVWTYIGKDSDGEKNYYYRFCNCRQKYIYRLVESIYEKASINLDIFKKIVPEYTENPFEEFWYYYAHPFGTEVIPVSKLDPRGNYYKRAKEEKVKYGRYYFEAILVPPRSTFTRVDCEKEKIKDPYKNKLYELLTESNSQECVTLVGQKTGVYGGTDLYIDGQQGAIYNLSGIEKFGYIYNVSDFYANTAKTLLEKSTKFFDKFKYDYMTIEVSAVDLHYLNPDIQSFELLQQVICSSEPHNLNTDPTNVLYFPVTEIDVDLVTPENTKYTLNSNINKAISKSVSSSDKNFNKYVEETKIPSVSEILEAAKSHADDIIKKSIYSSYAGFIYDNQNFELNDEVQLKPVDPENPSLGNRSCGIRIADGPTDKEATHKWVWYAGGLGHYVKTEKPNDYKGKVVQPKDAAAGKGYWSQSPNVAITMDGKIVADFITTGKLILGGSGSSASLVVYNDDEFIGSWGKDGIKIFKGELNIGKNQFKVTTDGHVEAQDISIGSKATIYRDKQQKNLNGLFTALEKADDAILNIDGKDPKAQTKLGQAVHSLTAWNEARSDSEYLLRNDKTTKDENGKKRPIWSVDNKGVMRMYAGSIGIGWSTALYNPDTKKMGAWNVMITDTGRFYMRHGEIRLGLPNGKKDEKSGANWNFRVGDDGHVVINQGDINLGWDSKNKIYKFTVNNDGELFAAAGTFKGELRVGTNTSWINQGGSKTNAKASNLYVSDDGHLYIGCTKKDDNWTWNFHVTPKGELTARDGVFSGKITSATMRTKESNSTGKQVFIGADYIHVYNTNNETSGDIRLFQGPQNEDHGKHYQKEFGIASDYCHAVWDNGRSFLKVESWWIIKAAESWARSAGLLDD